MSLTHDEIIARGDEMFKLLETLTEYSNKYGRPSLADISVFETMKERFETLDQNDQQANADIYRAWADYLESGRYFTLEYGWEQQEEEVIEFLDERGIITDIQECDYCGMLLNNEHDCNEDEDED